MSASPIALSDSAQAFVSFWKSLRQAEPMPQSARFLDCADARFQPYVAFNDIDPAGENVVTLFGTGLTAIMNSDWTGLSTTDFLPPQAAENMRQDFTMCAVHPCGMAEVSSFVTSASRSATMEIVSLPLKMGTSPRMRIVRFHRLIEVLHKTELMTADMRFVNKQWLDVGGGLPTRDPLPSAMPPR